MFTITFCQFESLQIDLNAAQKKHRVNVGPEFNEFAQPAPKLCLHTLMDHLESLWVRQEFAFYHALCLQKNAQLATVALAPFQPWQNKNPTLLACVLTQIPLCGVTQKAKAFLNEQNSKWKRSHAWYWLQLSVRGEGEKEMSQKRDKSPEDLSEDKHYELVKLLFLEIHFMQIDSSGMRRALPST